MLSAQLLLTMLTLVIALLAHLAQVLWPAVMWFAMVRSPLTGKDEYKEAVGQFSDHAQRLFQMQPQRELAIAAMLGGTPMDLLRFTPRPDQARLKRTTLLSVQRCTDTRLVVCCDPGEPSSVPAAAGEPSSDPATAPVLLGPAAAGLHTACCPSPFLHLSQRAEARSEQL